MSEIKPSADASVTASRADTSVTRQPKKLFKYYMDHNIREQQQQLNFFNRVNRWRYDTAMRQHSKLPG